MPSEPPEPEPLQVAGQQFALPYAEPKQGPAPTGRRRRASAQDAARVLAAFDAAPGLTRRELADKLGLSYNFVQTTLQGRRWQAGVPPGDPPSASAMPPELSEEVQRRLAQVAVQRGWTPQLLAQAQATWRDPRTPAWHRSELLEGLGDPLVVGPGGHLVSPGPLMRPARGAEEVVVGDVLAQVRCALDGLEAVGYDRLQGSLSRRQWGDYRDRIALHLRFLGPLAPAYRRQRNKKGRGGKRPPPKE